MNFATYLLHAAWATDLANQQPNMVGRLFHKKSAGDLDCKLNEEFGVQHRPMMALIKANGKMGKQGSSAQGKSPREEF